MRTQFGLAVGVATLTLSATGLASDFAFWPGDPENSGNPDLCQEDGIYYVEGEGVGWERIAPYDDYNNPCTAAGPPTVDTTGDDDDEGTGPQTNPVPVVPVNPAFRAFEIVSIGQGGHLILAFDHPVADDPLNPCGIDFIVFGNSLQIVDWENRWTNGDPNDTQVEGVASIEPSVVSVSVDGVNWHPFTDGPWADDFPPTLGRVYDPENPELSLPGNAWWSQATDPTYPLDPTLTAAGFDNWTVAQIAKKYGYSAGGTGFDIGELGLSSIQYVKIENSVGSGRVPEIDAVADVRGFAFPDLDCDSDVDQADLDRFEACATGPGVGLSPSSPPWCERTDFDGDGDVDQSDFGLWQRCVTGPDVLVDWDCMD